MKKYVAVVLPTALFAVTIGFLFVPHGVFAFAQEYQYSTYDPAGFFSGIWNGLLAPWTLIARWFVHDIVMYAIPNTGWFYDFGFLLGVIFSIPVGWLLALLSLGAHLFGFI